MLKILGAIVLLTLIFKIVIKDLRKPLPVPEKVTRYENYFIDEQGILNYYKKIDTWG
jgi:hypothetical protein